MTAAQEKALVGLINALTDWPCDSFEWRIRENSTEHLMGAKVGEVRRKDGRVRYRTEYTVAQARRSWQAVQAALAAFPSLKVDVA